MYLRKVTIKNVRSIKHFEMTFPEGNEAGWHVIIGDNGSGKSSVVRSIAVALIGDRDIMTVRPNWDHWLAVSAKESTTELEVFMKDEEYKTQKLRGDLTIHLTFHLKMVGQNGLRMVEHDFKTQVINSQSRKTWEDFSHGVFSVAYGPFRRFTGGNAEWNKVYYSSQKAGAHLSVFGEDIALTEALSWLQQLDYERLKEAEGDKKVAKKAHLTLDGIRKLINQSGFLPYDATFENIGKEGLPLFKDGNGNLINVTQMSDGFRSILSLTFELIRQLISQFGVDAVFKNNQDFIDCEGVVLIDEIDAHLHPTWQTRIGQWFTKFFPKLQFIVTTHSPLICRACEKGSIWRLAAPGSEIPSGEITGIDRDRLIYGDVLDAYGTDLFGPNIERTQESAELLKEYARLDRLYTFGQITAEQDEKRKRLQQIFSNNVEADF